MIYYGKGNIVAALDGTGSVAAQYRYDTFGKLLGKTGTLNQPFGFSTKRTDLDLGLVYYGYRFYNPDMERWMNRDPLGEAGGVNLYAFVGNNPVSWVDPWGLYSFDNFLYDSGNFFAGFGDTLTSGFGLFNTSLTQIAREHLGSDDIVNKCSDTYTAGKLSGYAWGITAVGVTSASILNNGIIINGTRVIQIHKHTLSMNILKSAGYSRKAAGALRNTPLWHANWGKKGHFIFRKLLGK